MNQPAHDRAIPPIEQFEWLYTRARLRDGISEVFSECGVRIGDEALDRIIMSPPVRDAYIAAIYNAERARGTKAEWLYMMIGEVFAVSPMAVRNIVQCKSGANTAITTVLIAH